MFPNQFQKNKARYLEDGINGILFKKLCGYSSAGRFGGLAVWNIDVFCFAWFKKFKLMMRNLKIFI